MPEFIHEQARSGVDPVVDRSEPHRSRARLSRDQNSLLSTQQASGNQAMQVLLHPGGIRAKLTIGQAGDLYEQEADRIAERVIRLPEAGATKIRAVSSEDRGIQTRRKCAACGDDERQMQTKRMERPQTVHNEAPRLVHEALLSSGQPLDATTRTYMEPRFGHDFSHVRIHTDDRAAAAASSVGALAFAVGRDIVFGSGHFAPNSEGGRRLLSHELAHVVQVESRSETNPTGGETVLRQGTSAGGSPGSPDPCLDILEQIIELLNELARRINDALDDPHNLYKNFRTTPHPDYGSWTGHRDRFYYDRERLRHKIAEWESDDRCRGYPLNEQQQEELNEAYDYKEKEFPDRPATSMSEGQDLVLETVLRAVIVLGLSIVLVPTIVAALADPEPASKLALAGLAVAVIVALGRALGFATGSSSPGAAPSSSPEA